LSHQVVFSEGKRPYNDNLPSWKGIVLADKIALLNEPLYFRRVRPGSYQQTYNESHFVIIDVMKEIAGMLTETGLYQTYKNRFEKFKLDNWYCLYAQIPFSIRSSFLSMIRDSLTEEDRMFYRFESGKSLRKPTLCFYRGMIDGNRLELVKHYCIEAGCQLGRFIRGIVFRPVRAFLIYQSSAQFKTEMTAHVIPLPSQESDEISQQKATIKKAA